MIKLSIIIPVFNEEQTIDRLLHKVVEARLPKNINKEIIVVDDGSEDNSKFKIQNSKFKTMKKVFHEKNLGKGAAIKSGLKVATGDYIIIQDADLEYDPVYYTKLLEPVIKENASVVYGTRLKNYPLRFWGKHKTVLPSHLIANRFLSLLTNLLYGAKLTDMETGYKLFKREILQKISLESKRFEFEPEITTKILRLKIPIVEIPIKVTPRSYKEGKKIGWLDGIMALWTLIKYRVID